LNVAEITLTVSGSVGFAPTWGVTFDHAALVTAGRSRADAKDIYVRHTASGAIDLKAVVGANTATCSVDFIATTNTVGDTGYRIGFGDLGWQDSRVVAGAYSYVGSVTAASVPTLVLPAPGYVLERASLFDSAAMGYPASLSPRYRSLSDNERERVTINWANVTAEDWYEIRAFVRAQVGGASTFTAPAWLGTTLYSIVPGSYSGEQFSRRGYRASLTVESVCV
jgi:hypothetical protein